MMSIQGISRSPSFLHSPFGFSLRWGRRKRSHQIFPEEANETNNKTAPASPQTAKEESPTLQIKAKDPALMQVVVWGGRTKQKREG
ncbi:hypothetical protein TNCT_305401 [Trichonephila clavata]|uniref:Uncharacterized protein n=1 Tax=Trichonephila clavata TaxID=2740835 RepID=A0A8X6F7E6_TRICU|nr:hypothetical protein TNCT_305401 [Trichonephila clavata]